MPRFALVSFVVVLTIACFAGCTTRGHGNGFPPDDDAMLPGHDAGTIGTGDDAGPLPDAGPRDAMATVYDDDTIVWAHSANELFAFDPRTNMVRTVGTFHLPAGTAPAMTDLAVNSMGQIYTCSATALFSVDSMTAAVTHISDLMVSSGVQFNGLTFLPAGLIDPGETLVGATSAGVYYKVDPATGRTTRLGMYSDGYGSSGDIVSVAGAGTFATVKRMDLTSDLLVQIDPASGHATPVGSGTGFSRLFGLGYWRSRLFGFSAQGELIEIDAHTGVGTLVASMTGATQFYGAGVTTAAPIVF